MAAGVDEEESVESEAGAYLIAETDHEVRRIGEMVASYIEATNRAGGGG